MIAGAVLAGGAGRRLGRGSKAAVQVGGRALISYPLVALTGMCHPVAIVCKAATELPGDLEGAQRWDEPDEPRHPLTGIVHALERAGGPVVVCAADMPFVTSDAVSTLLEAPDASGSPAVVAVADGVLQPVFGLYAPAALDVLRSARPDAPLTETVEALHPGRVAMPAPLLRSVNTPEELAEADAALGA